MKNWNTGISYDVTKMSESEFNEAVLHWALGSDDLEKLLRICHQKNILTTGCHNSFQWNYVNFLVNEVSRPYLSKILMLTGLIPQTQVLFHTDGGNPLGRELWQVPYIGISGNPDIFEAMTHAILFPGKSKSPFKEMLNIYDFLANKRIFLTVRMQHFRNDSYKISFEFSEYSETARTKYLTHFFEMIGFNKILNVNKGILEFSSQNIDVFNEKLLLLDNELRYDFDPPQFFEERDFIERCYRILDEQGVDEANKYIEVNMQNI